MYSWRETFNRCHTLSQHISYFCVNVPNVLLFCFYWSSYFPKRPISLIFFIISSISITFICIITSPFRTVYVFIFVLDLFQWLSFERSVFRWLRPEFSETIRLNIYIVPFLIYRTMQPKPYKMYHIFYHFFIKISITRYVILVVFLWYVVLACCVFAIGRFGTILFCFYCLLTYLYQLITLLFSLKIYWFNKHICYITIKFWIQSITLIPFSTFADMLNLVCRDVKEAL